MGPPRIPVRFIGVARIVGEAKREAHPTSHVFVRGQIENYHAMRASLFRVVPVDEDSLRSAEIEFAQRLSERINVARFKAPNLGGLLQHYGFRTSWLDVLDNLFVAYWFAGHRITEKPNGAIQICESGGAAGWLFVTERLNAATEERLKTGHAVGALSIA